MRLVLFVLLALVAVGCVPTSATPPTPLVPAAPRSALVTIFAPLRDYQIGTRRPGGDACSGTGSIARYLESLEYIDLPPVLFGLDEEDCIQEIRVGYADESGRFDHAVSLVTQRLGTPDGEDRATCLETGSSIHAVYWLEPEGRFEVVRGSLAASPEFVLRASNAASVYPRLCASGVSR